MEYIHVIYIILEIFSCTLLINIAFTDYFGDNWRFSADSRCDIPKLYNYISRFVILEYIPTKTET